MGGDGRLILILLHTKGAASIITTVCWLRISRRQLKYDCYVQRRMIIRGDVEKGVVLSFRTSFVLRLHIDPRRKRVSD